MNEMTLESRSDLPVIVGHEHHDPAMEIAACSLGTIRQ
jgi:hypothetical protein